MVCVDDSPDVNLMMSRLIDSTAGMACVGCLDSADRLIDEVRNLGATVVLLDATMPGKPPLDEMRKLAAQSPEVKTIVFSGYDDPAFICAALEAGAWGCVSKYDEPDAILQAVQRAAEGMAWVPRR